MQTAPDTHRPQLMQMTLRNRILDLLPIVVLFAVITAFATAVIVRVIEEPMTPPAHSVPAEERPAD